MQEIPVVCIVTFAADNNRDQDELRAVLEEAGPRYVDVPGLRRKYFIYGDGVGGGVYEWESRAAADAFYNDEWRAGALARFGAEPQVDFYQAPAIADGVSHRFELYLPKVD